MSTRRRLRIARYIVYRQTIVNPADHLWTFIGAFFGIASIGYIQQHHLASQDTIFLIGSFGASAVLVFGATNSPLAQPRNLIFGHLLSALVGVSVSMFVPGPVWFTAALAVASAIVVMQITKTMHPPGGATALIAVIGSDTIKDLGYRYVVTPVGSGVFLLLMIALLINNIPKNRYYPYRRNYFRTERLLRRLQRGRIRPNRQEEHPVRNF